MSTFRKALFTHFLLLNDYEFLALLALVEKITNADTLLLKHFLPLLNFVHQFVLSLFDFHPK